MTNTRTCWFLFLLYTTNNCQQFVRLGCSARRDPIHAPRLVLQAAAPPAVCLPCRRTTGMQRRMPPPPEQKLADETIAHWQRQYGLDACRAWGGINAARAAITQEELARWDPGLTANPACRCTERCRPPRWATPGWLPSWPPRLCRPPPVWESLSISQAPTRMPNRYQREYTSGFRPDNSRPDDILYVPRHPAW